MAPTVPAHGSAERHVQVDRSRLPHRHRLQPTPIALFANRRREMRGRGITGVARQPVLPVGSRQVRSHLLFSCFRINYRTWSGSTLRWLNPPPIAGTAMFAAAAL